MNRKKQIRWHQLGFAHRDTTKKIVIGGIAFLFFLFLAGCVTGASETVVRTPQLPKIPAAPAADAKPAPKPVPAKPAVKSPVSVADEPVNKETPPVSLKKSIQNSKPEPVSTQTADKASEVPTPPPAPAASAKVAKKPEKAVQPLSAAATRQEPLAFYLKKEEPEDASKLAATEPKPASTLIVIYTLPENKRFHGVHQPINKSETCISAKCHAKRVKENKYVHAPVATGACALCHGDTKDNPPYGLIRTGQDFCLSCYKPHVSPNVKLLKYFYVK